MQRSERKYAAREMKPVNDNRNERDPGTQRAGHPKRAARWEEVKLLIECVIRISLALFLNRF